uniref:Paramyosin, long form n=1 Tax=Cacopsylla melanoneura TaxID=428564 RepID=A0A8D8VZV4_9HEMI
MLDVLGREELSASYKEAEAGRKAEEQRAQRLAAEYAQFSHEAEKRLHEEDEEIEHIWRSTIWCDSTLMDKQGIFLKKVQTTEISKQPKFPTQDTSEVDRHFDKVMD